MKQIFFSEKVLGPKNNFWSKRYLVQKKNCLRKNVGPRKKFVHPKKHFGLKKNWVQKVVGPKDFGSKIGCQKILSKQKR